MNTKVISSAEPTTTLHLSHRHPTTKKPRSTSVNNISFSSQISKSRLLLIFSNKKNQFIRNGAPGGIRAFYAETAESLYQVLGLPESSGTNLSDIKKAYKVMARKYHPDVSPPERVDEYTRRFIMVHEAYETLSNPNTRASYDRDLSAGGFSNMRREETEDWKRQWENQLDELNRKNNSRGKMSWGARMRSQRAL